MITYAIPCNILLVSWTGMSKYHPESARPRTSTFRPAILSLRASLSKLRITPIPPALWNETNIRMLLNKREVRFSETLVEFFFFESLWTEPQFICLLVGLLVFSLSRLLQLWTNLARNMRKRELIIVIYSRNRCQHPRFPFKSREMGRHALELDEWFSATLLGSGEGKNV